MCFLVPNIIQSKVEICSKEHFEQKLNLKQSRFLGIVVAQSCPTLYDPMDCSLQGSSVSGIFQARVVEWVAISFSRGSSQPRDLLHYRQTLYPLSHQGAVN